MRKDRINIYKSEFSRGVSIFSYDVNEYVVGLTRRAEIETIIKLLRQIGENSREVKYEIGIVFVLLQK